MGVCKLERDCGSFLPHSFNPASSPKDNSVRLTLFTVRSVAGLP